MALFTVNMVEVHVLLVGSDVVSLLETRKLLEFNSYRVTAVTVAAIASSLLVKEKVKYDVVMVDVSSSDVQGFQLAHDAINSGYTVILMSDNLNTTLVKCAIEDGAFMFIQKPASMEVLKYLWQHVLRESTRKAKECARFREMVSTIESSNFILNGGACNVIHPSNIEASINVHDQPGSPSMAYRNGFEGFKPGLMEEQMYMGKNKKPKICTEWTQELHDKFVEAVKELGEGRCFPRDILEVMNVPGLKRMQVASHLQKCRQGWKPDQERRQDGSVPSTSYGQYWNGHSRQRRRGTYPRVAKGAQPKFLFRNKSIDHHEQAPPTQVADVSNPIRSTEPENMQQNVETLTDINVSNHINNVNVNEMISRDNMNHGGQMAAVESNQIDPSFDSFDFALDGFDGSMYQMDHNFEGFDLDQNFYQNNSADDEDPGSSWRQFLSNF